jgi:L-fuculose-phosphate aldolase
MDTRKILRRIGKEMKDAGLVAACDGNLSFRREDGSIVITPSGVPKGLLTSSQLIVLSPDGDVLKGNGKPSSETNLHLLVYKNRPDVNAIIHAHPTVATAFSVTGLPFPSDIVTEGKMVLGKVPTVGYAGPGSMDLAMACAGALKKANVILMESHGATTVGKNLDEAFFRMETLEKVATIYRDSLTFASAYRLTRQLDCLHDITSLFK